MIVFVVPCVQLYNNNTEMWQLVHYITTMGTHNAIYKQKAVPILLFITSIHSHKNTYQRILYKQQLDIKHQI